jgi:hypothetical protein
MISTKQIRVQAEQSIGSARLFTTALIDSFPVEHYCWQSFAGQNHLLWIVGHLARIDDLLLNAVTQPRESRLGSLEQLFEPGSQPQPESEYPKFEIVREHFDSLRTEMMAWFRNLSDIELTQSLPEYVQHIGSSPIDAIFGLAWHEGLHAGQITTLRRALQEPPLFF